MKRMLVYLVGIIFTLSVNAQQPQPENPLRGKRIGMLGDSYVRNHLEPVENTWHYKLAQKHGMEYFNYGINGNCVAMTRGRFGEAMYLRYQKEMADSLDYVVVIAGHNDAYLLDSIGGIEPYKEKLAILCEGLINKYPSAQIFFFTRWICDDFAGSDSEKVIEATLEVCSQYSIPVFNSAKESGIYANNPAFRKIYFQSPDDTAHLNAKGHDRFLRCAEHFILRY